jgi:hypothetical protein
MGKGRTALPAPGSGPTGTRGPTGSRGPTGAKGATGAKGPTGVNSLTGQLSIQSAAASGTTATITCPGTFPNVVSGGYTGIGGGGNGQYTVESFPSASNKWTVTIENTDASWTIYAVCAK